MTTADGSPLDVPPPGRYTIDTARSTVTYSGRHMFGLRGVQATFTINSGELLVCDPSSASTVDVSLDAASFSSNSPKRDKDVRSAALLNVAAYPEITFRSDGMRPAGQRWLLTGQVTAHGKAVPVEVMIERVSLEDGGVRVRARSEHIDRYAFGVTKSKGIAGRYLDLDFDVLATKVDEASPSST